MIRITNLDRNRVVYFANDFINDDSVKHKEAGIVAQFLSKYSADSSQKIEAILRKQKWYKAGDFYAEVIESTMSSSIKQIEKLLGV